MPFKIICFLFALFNYLFSYQFYVLFFHPRLFHDKFAHDITCHDVSISTYMTLNFSQKQLTNITNTCTAKTVHVFKRGFVLCSKSPVMGSSPDAKVIDSNRRVSHPQAA